MLFLNSIFKNHTHFQFAESMSDRKAVIKNADMSEEMQQDAVDCATQALDKFNIEKVIYNTYLILTYSLNLGGFLYVCLYIIVITKKICVQWVETIQNVITCKSERQPWPEVMSIDSPSNRLPFSEVESNLVTSLFIKSQLWKLVSGQLERLKCSFKLIKKQPATETDVKGTSSTDFDLTIFLDTLINIRSHWIFSVPNPR